MATTQEALDLKYEILKAEEQQKLTDMFSIEILSQLQLQGINTIQGALDYNSSIKIDAIAIQELKGLEYLKNVSTIDIWQTELNQVNVSNNHNATVCNIYQNPNLEYIGNLKNLSLVTDLFIYSNALKSLGRINTMSSLVQIQCFNNNFSQQTVNKLLEDIVWNYNNNGQKISIVNLSGNSSPTNGVNNSDYQYLISQGVTVTIDV